jgi:hypothetical protein
VGRELLNTLFLDYTNDKGLQPRSLRTTDVEVSRFLDFVLGQQVPDVEAVGSDESGSDRGAMLWHYNVE